MTKKALLQEWASAMGAPTSDDPTVAELEQAITLSIHAQQVEPQPPITFSEALANNLQVLRSELPGAARAVAQNLFS
jgi:hypothetical protein